MDKGGRPCGKSAATLKREREAEEKANPETRQRRMDTSDTHISLANMKGTRFMGLDIPIFLKTRCTRLQV